MPRLPRADGNDGDAQIVGDGFDEIEGRALLPGAQSQQRTQKNVVPTGGRSPAVSVGRIKVDPAFLRACHLVAARVSNDTGFDSWRVMTNHRIQAKNLH